MDPFKKREDGEYNRSKCASSDKKEVLEKWCIENRCYKNLAYFDVAINRCDIKGFLQSNIVPGLWKKAMTGKSNKICERATRSKEKW